MNKAAAGPEAPITALLKALCDDFRAPHRLKKAQNHQMADAIFQEKKK